MAAGQMMRTACKDLIVLWMIGLTSLMVSGLRMQSAAAAPSSSTIDFPAAPMATAPMGATDDDEKPARPAMRPPIAPAPSAMAPQPTRSGNPLWGTPLRSLNVTRERPIFVPSRRPAPVNAPVVFAPPPPPPPAPPPVPERPQLSLLGTVSADRDGIAVFFDQGARSIVRLRIGQAHLQWVLRSIDGRSVALQRNDVTETLTLPKPTDPPRVPIALPDQQAVPASTLPTRPLGPNDEEYTGPPIDMR